MGLLIIGLAELVFQKDGRQEIGDRRWETEV
jgi:hypothetical protein